MRVVSMMVVASWMSIGGSHALGQPVSQPASQPLPQRTITRLTAELQRLATRARAERRASSLRPVPSAEMSFYLLHGVGWSYPTIPVTPALKRQLGITSNWLINVRIHQLNPSARVVCSDTNIQDKAGPYRLRSCSLMLREGHRWAVKGSGTLVLSP